MTPFGQSPAFCLRVKVCPPEALNSASGGPVRLVSIAGGTVAGILQGSILPGGSDWQTIRNDGVIEIEARYLIELQDGARVELQNRGRRNGSLGPFWSTIWLHTEDEAYRWVNSAQFLARGSRRNDVVEIEAFTLPDCSQ